MRIPKVREVGVRILGQRIDFGISLQTLFESRPFRSLERRDRRLARALVDGVLRNLRRIDFQLQHFSTRPLERIDPEVLWILRVGLYELTSLRIPPYATVDEAVHLCRLLKKQSAGGFVNAILRRALAGEVPLPMDLTAESLAVRYSHPKWLVERYLGRYPPEFVEKTLQRNNQTPESVLWVNPLRATLEGFCQALESEGITPRRVDGLENAVQIDQTGFQRNPLYRQGQCFFMDPSSQRIAELPDLSGSELIGDFCAAPGGKSFIMASRMPPGTRIISGDVQAGRLLAMRQRATLLNITGIDYVQADLTKAMPLADHFDFVLLDVPCSGLGTIRSNPDLRWTVTEADLQRHHARQVLLLKNGFRSLKRGGGLVYSTCSTEPEENESVIEEFLSREAGARLDEPYFRTFPVNQGLGDGFFAAKVRRL